MIIPQIVKETRTHLWWLYDEKCHNNPQLQQYE